MLTVAKSVFLILVLIVSSHSFGQSSNDSSCYEIKYLDFFALKDVDFPKWSKSNLEMIKERVLSDQGRDTSRSLGMEVPLIAYQLQQFHPKCVTEGNEEYLNQIIDLYFTSRKIDTTRIVNLSLNEQIDFIRDDFYELVKDDQNLVEMSFILDDGPFYGVDTDTTGAVTDSLKTKFGYLKISELNENGTLSAFDEENQLLWSKSITGLNGRELGRITTTIHPIRETSLATIFTLFASGERLTVYVKNSGSFMYYFHSW